MKGFSSILTSLRTVMKGFSSILTYRLLVKSNEEVSYTSGCTCVCMRARASLFVYTNTHSISPFLPLPLSLSLFLCVCLSLSFCVCLSLFLRSVRLHTCIDTHVSAMNLIGTGNVPQILNMPGQVDVILFPFFKQGLELGLQFNSRGEIFVAQLDKVKMP